MRRMVVIVRSQYLCSPYNYRPMEDIFFMDFSRPFRNLPKQILKHCHKSRTKLLKGALPLCLVMFYCGNHLYEDIMLMPAESLCTNIHNKTNMYIFTLRITMSQSSE